MNFRLSKAALVATHSVVVQTSGHLPSRDVEQERVAFLIRRLGINPQLAAVVSPIAFSTTGVR